MDKKMTVEEMKAIRETSFLVPLGRIYILCDTALTLHAENARLQAEVERLGRYEKAWKMIKRYADGPCLEFIERDCGIPQDEEKEGE
jgi:hypothetical protein